MSPEHGHGNEPLPSAEHYSEEQLNFFRTAANFLVSNYGRTDIGKDGSAIDLCEWQDPLAEAYYSLYRFQHLSDIAQSPSDEDDRYTFCLQVIRLQPNGQEISEQHVINPASHTEDTLDSEVRAAFLLGATTRGLEILGGHSN